MSFTATGNKNTRYVQRTDTQGNTYTEFQMQRQMNHTPNTGNVDARFDGFIPNIVYLPYHLHMPYHTAAISQALINSATDFVDESTLPSQCHILDPDPATSVPGNNQTVGGGSYLPLPNNRFDADNCFAPRNFFVHEDDIGKFDISNYDDTGTRYPLQRFLGCVASTADYTYGTTSWSNNVGTLASDVITYVEPNGTVHEMHRNFLNAYGSSTTSAEYLWMATAELVPTDDYQHGDPNHATFVAYDINNRRWLTSSAYRWSLDGTATKFVACNYFGSINVRKYGNDFYDVNVAMSIQHSAGTQGLHIGARTSGTVHLKSKFPDKGSSTVPLRYVKYHRPQGTATPVDAHPGFTLSICSDNFAERAVLDDNVATGHQELLMFGDRTLVDLNLSLSGTANVEARRLKLPNPTIQDQCVVTLPWNNEDIMFDRAATNYDFSVSTSDLLNWRAKAYGANGSASCDAWTILGAASHGMETPVIFGIISRTQSFTTRLPYVRRTDASSTF